MNEYDQFWNYTAKQSNLIPAENTKNHTLDTIANASGFENFLSLTKLGEPTELIIPSYVQFFNLFQELKTNNLTIKIIDEKMIVMKDNNNDSNNKQDPEGSSSQSL